MIKKVSFFSLVFLMLFFAGCSNEKGNNLHIGVEGNNLKVKSVGEFSRDDQLTLINNLYRGLFQVKGDNDVVPVLAESFSYSEDGKIMYIEVKEGFSWSDGKPVTITDIVQGLKNNIDNSSGKYSYQYRYLDNKAEENIRINENNQIEIFLSREFTDFEKILALPIFYPVLNSEDPLAGPFSGDFIVEKNSKDKITLVPRDKEKAIAEKKTESIIFEYSLGKDKLAKGYQNKDFDIIFPETINEEVKGNKINAPGIKLLWLNGSSEDFKNIEARKSVYQSLDKMDGIYPKSYRGQDVFEKINMKSEYSFKNSQFKLLLLDSPEEIKIGEKIKEQLGKKLNLDVEILAKSPEEYFTELRKGNFDLALETWEGDYQGKNSYFELFKNPVSSPLNVSGIISSEINNLQKQVNSIADSPEREAMFKDLEKKIVESVSAIMLSEGIEKDSYIQRVKNVGIDSIYNYHDYNNIKY